MSAVVTVASDSSTVVVSWNPAFSGMCDVFARDYAVRYRVCGCSSNYTTVNISGTSVTLQGLAPNAEYGVEVSAINSNGDLSDFSAISQFTVTPTTAAAPSKTLLPLTVIYVSIFMQLHNIINILSWQAYLTAQSFQPIYACPF